MAASGALIVSPFGNTAERLRALLCDTIYADASVVQTASDARKALAETPCPLLLINAPLVGGDEKALALDAAQNTYAAIILLAKPNDIPEGLTEYGVMALEKPVSQERLRCVLCCAEALCKRVAFLRRENLLLKRQMQEQRVVSRAKELLISVLSMTEPQAHRFIEKQAMDMRQTRAEIAVRIIKTYEDRQQSE